MFSYQRDIPDGFLSSPMLIILCYKTNCFVTIKFLQLIDPSPGPIEIHLHRGLREKLYPEGLLKLKAISFQILWMATYVIPR